MKSELLKYNYFQESQIIEVVFKNCFETIEITIERFLDENQYEIKNTTSGKFYKLIFSLVQDFRIFNDFNDFCLQNPNEIHEGINEFTKIDIEENSIEVKKYLNCNLNFNHYVFFWEHKRRLDIVCGELKIIKIK